MSPLIRVESICTSAEGRDVPLLVVGKPLPRDPLALRYDKRLVVYFQANIHAGEVEGKEATLMLVRDILLDPKLPYLDKVVLLVAPVFNADGNDKMSPDNRRGQVGPDKAGVRHNGQNLDLNRDAMKLESPEMRGLVRNVLMRWDPVLTVDCHTTDGSYHEEPVTYSWPLCPNGDPSIIAYMRDKMMPAVDATLEKKYGGLAVARLTEPATLEVEAFRIKEIKGSERIYQGHRTNTVTGEYAVERKEFPAGTLVVRTAQPLGNLAAYLLEPESDDGLLVWNAFDRHVVTQWGRGAQTYPVYKLLTPVSLAAVAAD